MFFEKNNAANRIEIMYNDDIGKLVFPIKNRLSRPIDAVILFPSK